MGVDNAIVEMDANEPPIGDGSARPYVELIKKAGIVAQEAPRRVFDVREPMHVETKSGSLLVIAAGSKVPDFLHASRPGRPIHAIFLHRNHARQFTKREIAPARTFVYYEDVQPLMDKNLIKGGSLENAIVVRGESVLSKEPLRFPDEFVRHKILDIIGDLALFGQRIRGHVIAVKPGHGANAELARALAKEYARTSRCSCRRAFPPGEGGLDINEVMQMLPHRYPFLMVDRIMRFEGETKMHRREVGHDQRAVFSGPFSRPSGHAGRAASGSDGAGGEHPDDETHQERQLASVIS